MVADLLATTVDQAAPSQAWGAGPPPAPGPPHPPLRVPAPPHLPPAHPPLGLCPPLWAYPENRRHALPADTTSPPTDQCPLLWPPPLGVPATPVSPIWAHPRTCTRGLTALPRGPSPPTDTLVTALDPAMAAALQRRILATDPHATVLRDRPPVSTLATVAPTRPKDHGTDKTEARAARLQAAPLAQDTRACPLRRACAWAARATCPDKKDPPTPVDRLIVTTDLTWCRRGRVAPLEWAHPRPQALAIPLRPCPPPPPPPTAPCPQVTTVQRLWQPDRMVNPFMTTRVNSRRCRSRRIIRVDDRRPKEVTDRSVWRIY